MTSYLDCLVSTNCSLIEDFLKWILSIPRDLGGRILGECGTELDRCPARLKASLART